jgi:S1-C subfamily serine protease
MCRHFKFFILVVFVCVLLTSVAGCFKTTTENNPMSLTTPVLEDVSMVPRLIEPTNVKTGIEVSKNVSAAVVGITSSNAYSYSVGSGVSVAKGGYVLTNYHVITNPNSIKLYLADGATTSASFIWGDYALDMAIVKSSIDLPYLKMAPGTEPSVGEDVLAIGTPLQLQFKHSVTKGIVSALNRTVQVEDDGSGSYLQSLIQHDASINPGNSGGPLINLNSEVVGINTLKIESAEGMGFAIPAIVIDNVLKNVLSDGTYESAYLGVFGYDSSIPYYYKKTNSKNGLYVIDVQENSPASKAGMKSGDVILAINDKQVNTSIDFKREFFAYRENDVITVKLMQDGQVKTVEVTLQKRPVSKAKKEQPLSK